MEYNTDQSEATYQSRKVWAHCLILAGLVLIELGVLGLLRS